MSFAPHLTLISEVMEVLRRDFYLNDTTILNPNGANPLLDGEWLQLNSSYQMVRGAGEYAFPGWQVFAERGRYDTQAITKVPVLFMKGYEAETDIAASIGSLVVGDRLVVNDVTIGGLVKKGLQKAAGMGQHLVHAWVTRIVGSGSTQKVRFWTPNAPMMITI